MILWCRYVWLISYHRIVARYHLISYHEADFSNSLPWKIEMIIRGWYCDMILRGWCPHCDMILHRWCPYHDMILRGWCPHRDMMLRWWCPHHDMILHGWCSHHDMILRWWCPHHDMILCGWCPHRDMILLYCSVLQGNSEIVKMLLASGSNIFTLNSAGKSKILLTKNP